MRAMSVVLIVFTVAIASAAGIRHLGFGPVAEAATDASEGIVDDDGGPATEAAEVALRTLERTEEISGFAGFGDSFGAPTSAQGVTTWLPDEGAVLRPGATLARVDERPVTWTTGDLPMYRELRQGDEGPDVVQLQEFLAEQGLLERDQIDGDFGRATRAAVKAWQEHVGLKETGSVDASQLVFLPYDRIRVHSASDLGGPFDRDSITFTEPDAAVTATVTGSQRRLLERSGGIEVETADGRTVSATVRDVRTSASRSDTGAIQFDVTLHTATELGAEPVRINVTETLAEDALTVPVSAIVALREGGYAVETLSQGRRTYVNVELGEFADGFVEVRGDLAPGDRVMVPR